MNCRIVLAFVSMTHSITTLPTEFITTIEMLSLCTSRPIYLVLHSVLGLARIELVIADSKGIGAG